MSPEQRTHLERAGLALAGVLLLVLGFSAGRFSAPLQVETRDVERVVYRDLTVEDLTKGMTFAKTVQKTVYRNVVTTITDAGTVIADNSIEHEGAEESSSSTETKRTTEEHAGQRETEKTSVTTLRPDWRVGVQIGAALKPALVITGPLVLGASVERRIVGGVSAGLWGNTVGAGGASVSLEF